MNNINYYSLDQLKFEAYKLNDEYAALKISYIPKHSKELIILKSMICDIDNIVASKISWLFEKYEESMYYNLVNNPEDYKHIKRS